MFYLTFIELCSKIKKSPSAVAEEMGFKRSVITRWRNGTVPRDANLQRIADYFGVPVETLTAGQKESAPTVTDERDLEMLSLLSRLTPEQKEMLLLQIKGLLPPQE